MTATFTTTNLVDHRVLVQGTDFLGVEGKAVLDSSQWAEVNKHKEFDAATAEFDSAVEAFFAPLQEAADKIDAAMKGDKPDDSIGYVVISEEVTGVTAKPAHLVKLTKDSIILRLLEAGSFDRLVWVGDELEILQPAQSPAMTVDEVFDSAVKE